MTEQLQRAFLNVSSIKCKVVPFDTNVTEAYSDIHEAVADDVA